MLFFKLFRCLVLWWSFMLQPEAKLTEKNPETLDYWNLNSLPLMHFQTWAISHPCQAQLYSSGHCTGTNFSSSNSETECEIVPESHLFWFEDEKKPTAETKSLHLSPQRHCYWESPCWVPLNFPIFPLTEWWWAPQCTAAALRRPWN